METSTPECSVALLDTDRDALFEKQGSASNQHTECLFSLIDSVLSNSGNTYSHITHLATVVGPGSFTGIRVGLAAVKGMQLVTNLPGYGISALELQAYSISKLMSTNVSIMSIIPSRNNFAYTQTFSSNLLPESSISFLEQGTFSTDGYITHEHCTSPIVASAKVLAKYLFYKISHGLPELPLRPIYPQYLTKN